MDFFKTALLIALVACCFLNAIAQLSAYKKLSSEDLKQLCEKNGVNKDAIKTSITPLSTLVNDNIKIITDSKALEVDGECLGRNATSHLHSEMKIVKQCIEGEISLSDDEVKGIVEKSKEKMCALIRLGSYEQTIKSCLDYEALKKCEYEILKNSTIENGNEYANLGLTYSEKGRSIFIQLLDCTTKQVIERCGSHQNNIHAQLTKRVIQNLEPRN